MRSSGWGTQDGMSALIRRGRDTRASSLCHVRDTAGRQRSSEPIPAGALVSGFQPRELWDEMPVAEALPSVAFSYRSLGGLGHPVSEHFSGHTYSSLDPHLETCYFQRGRKTRPPEQGQLRVRWGRRFQRVRPVESGARAEHWMSRLLAARELHGSQWSSSRTSSGRWGGSSGVRVVWVKVRLPAARPQGGKSHQHHWGLFCLGDFRTSLPPSEWLIFIRPGSVFRMRMRLCAKMSHSPSVLCSCVTAILNFVYSHMGLQADDSAGWSSLGSFLWEQLDRAWGWSWLVRRPMALWFRASASALMSSPLKAFPLGSQGFGWKLAHLFHWLWTVYSTPSAPSCSLETRHSGPPNAKGGGFHTPPWWEEFQRMGGQV